ncbi:transcription factor E2F6-like [Rhodnius prolixus]
MSKIQRAIKLEDEEIVFHSTPDMHSIKFSSPSFREAVNNTTGSSPFHLIDHGYGRTPQSHSQRTSVNHARTQAVKRRLNLESSGDEDVGFKTPKSRKKNNYDSRMNKGQVKTPTRYDTSLGLLTKKFVNLLQRSPRGIVDLNYASHSLEVQKRRIYDITNVLEGVGILEKRSKNNIQWSGGSFTETQSDVQNEIENLEKQEKELDELIKRAENDVTTLLKDTRYAYVSYQDLRSIKSYATQTVIVIKAPPHAQLEVPQPTNRSRVEMWLKSENGEIDVFLCPEIKSSKEEKSGENSEPSTSRELNPTLSIPNPNPQSDEWRKKQPKMEKDNLENALITSADDFSTYQLQTEDQHSSEADPDSSFCEEPFLTLEPPISASDYLYSLDQDEGLMDLFDFNF